jgi:16S rRNA (guanine(1405)-N(7))-methyltransferase
MGVDVQAQTVDRICASAKYRTLCRETVRDVLARAVERHGDTTRAVALAREVLHRVAAFYLGEPDYDRARGALEACDGAAGRASVCRELLERHVSSRERLPILGQMYGELFARTGAPRSVADLACACNPFAYPWMGLGPMVRYHAYDINAAMVRLVARYFELEGIPGRAVHQDVLCEAPTEPVDVALLLKMYHCLEHRRRGAGWEVVSRIRARHLAVSFPSRNLRGRSADIAGNYREEILSRSDTAGWRCVELPFPGETVILVHKGAA